METSRRGACGHGTLSRAAGPGRRWIRVEDRHALRTLAGRVRDAVHRRVAAADDHHVLARGRQLRIVVGLRAAGDPAVARIQVVHREPHAGEIDARDGERTVHARADRQHDGVVGLDQLLGGQRAADVGAVLEGDPFGGQHGDAAVDHPLLQLGIRHAEAQQPTRVPRPARGP